MKKLVLLAATAAALAIPAAPASAACTVSTPRVAQLGNNYAELCSRRIWEKQQYYVRYCLDRDLDNRCESWGEKVLIEFYG